MKKILKIVGIALASAVVLYVIGFALTAYFTLSGIGNPIVRMKAQKAIVEYVEQEYPDNDFEEIKTIYNFKFGTYGAQIVSKSSVDTRFYVSYFDGVIDDSYDEYVTSGMNTFMRLEDEFDDYVTDLVEEQFENIELCLYDLYSTNSDGENTKNIADVVPLDGTLSITQLKELGFEPSITVWFMTNDITYENTAEKFRQLKAFMEENDVYASVYSVSLRLPEDSEDRFAEGIHAYDLSAEYIDSDDLIDKIIEIDEEGKQVTDKGKYE